MAKPTKPAAPAARPPAATDIIRVMHPRNRVIQQIRPHNMGQQSWRGFVVVPWDCTCPTHTTCKCDKRPRVPTPAQRAEAEVTLEELLAGINLARESEGIAALQLVRPAPRS